MINWDSYSQHKDIDRLQQEIRKLARPPDDQIDYAAIAQRCRQLRDAYAWAAMKDAVAALKYWMVQAAKRWRRHEDARQESC